MSSRLERIWRLFGTGFSFVLFGLGGLVLALSVFPFFNIFIQDRARRARWAQQTVHTSWRVYVWLMQALGVVSSECHGSPLLREARGTLIVANHPSLLDIVFLLSLMRRTQCVIKAGVWRNPFMAGVVKAANYIPNLGDPERLVRECADALKAGNNLVIFPEGSRTQPGKKHKYQRGFAYVALMAGAPIQIVSISCQPPSLRKGEKWYQIPPHRSHWIIRAHECIDVAADYQNLPIPIAVRNLCARVESKIEEYTAP